MNRTLLLLLTVLVLGGGIWLLKDEGKAPATSLVGADRDFSVDQDLVYKIFLANRNGHKTTLERTENGWIYNGQYKAREDAISSLLLAIDHIRLKFVPTQAAVPHMVESLASYGIKVEIYGQDGAMLKAYYVGGSTNDEMGTFVIMENSEQPYVAELENWTGNLRFRYNLMGDDWRDRSVFTSKIEDITEISIDYPKQQNNSFRLTINNGKNEVKPYYPLTPEIQKPLNNGAVEAFANSFERIYASRFKNLNKDQDSIKQQIPFAIITLDEKNGDRYSATLFPQVQKPFIDPKTGDLIVPESIDAYYCVMATGDFVMLQSGILKKILWGYPFFFE